MLGCSCVQLPEESPERATEMSKLVSQSGGINKYQVIMLYFDRTRIVN